MRIVLGSFQHTKPLTPNQESAGGKLWDYGEEGGVYAKINHSPREEEIGRHRVGCEEAAPEQRRTTVQMSLHWNMEQKCSS